MNNFNPDSFHKLLNIHNVLTDVMDTTEEDMKKTLVIFASFGVLAFFAAGNAQQIGNGGKILNNQTERTETNTTKGGVSVNVDSPATVVVKPDLAKAQPVPPPLPTTPIGTSDKPFMTMGTEIAAQPPKATSTEDNEANVDCQDVTVRIPSITGSANLWLTVEDNADGFHAAMKACNDTTVVQQLGSVNDHSVIVHVGQGSDKWAHLSVPKDRIDRLNYSYTHVDETGKLMGQWTSVGAKPDKRGRIVLVAAVEGSLTKAPDPQ